jgi:hypothetical protein
MEHVLRVRLNIMEEIQEKGTPEIHGARTLIVIAMTAIHWLMEQILLQDLPNPRLSLLSQDNDTVENPHQTPGWLPECTLCPSRPAIMVELQ